MVYGQGNGLALRLRSFSGFSAVQLQSAPELLELRALAILYPRDPSIQAIAIHWALMSIHITYPGLFGSLGVAFLNLFVYLLRHAPAEKDPSSPLLLLG